MKVWFRCFSFPNKYFVQLPASSFSGLYSSAVFRAIRERCHSPKLNSLDPQRFGISDQFRVGDSDGFRTLPVVPGRWQRNPRKFPTCSPGCWEYRRFIGIKTANLVGGWTNPFRKNLCLSNWVHLPQFIPIFRVKIKHIWNHQPEIYSNFNISPFLWNILG